MNPYAPPTAQVEVPMGPAKPPLRVQFQNSLLDLFLFQLYIQARSPVMLLILFGASAFMAYSVWSEADAHAQTLGFFGILMFVVLLALSIIQVLFVLAWILVHRDKSYAMPRTLEITDKAILDTTEFARYEVQWRGVHKVLRTSWCLYVCLTAMTAHCVPRRAFSDPESFARFSSMAVELSLEAKQAAAAAEHGR